MALVAENVVVAGTGHVYIAPAGTDLPTDLEAPDAEDWSELGYTSEDGVTFGLSREEETIGAWQSRDPIRRITTAEPKTVGMELLEFTPENVMLAFRGGNLTDEAGVGTLTPPELGATATYALLVDAIDGAYTFRFVYENVELGGDVEMSLVATDATRLPLEFGVNAGARAILSDHPAWATAVPPGSPSAASALPAKGAPRADWDAAATLLGVENASALGSKEDVIAAAEAAAARGA